jgi:hypothetical protein
VKTAVALETVHERFLEQTRGEGGKVVDGELVLETVSGVFVHVYLDEATYYGPIFNAYLQIPAQSFTVPLLEGPHIDLDPDDTNVWESDAQFLDEVVSWIRKITNSQADVGADECSHGFSGDCMICDPEPYEPSRDPACDGYIDDRD